MPLVYDKLFKLLKANGYNTTRIRNENLLGQRTLTATKNGTGGMDHRTIEKLCRIFNCQPNDFMEYIPDGSESIPQIEAQSSNTAHEKRIADLEREVRRLVREVDNRRPETIRLTGKDMIEYAKNKSAEKQGSSQADTDQTDKTEE